MSRDIGMIALHPQYWDMYKDGSKTWELRKFGYSPRLIYKLVVYATHPVSLIVGEMDLVRYCDGLVDDVWNIVKEACGITREQYNRYYQGHRIATAYHTGDVYEYTTPIEATPVQGYRYLSAETYWMIREHSNRRLVHAAR